MAMNDNNAITTGICAHDAIGVQSIVLRLQFALSDLSSTPRGMT